jgi:signal transduction histidine kinase
VAKLGKRDREEQLERERMAALGTLSAGVAHEINNPLTYVKILVSRLASLELAQVQDAGALHRLEILQDIREGMRRIEQIVRSLRAFAQVDDVDAGPVDVHVALEAALQMCGHEIHHRARLARDYVEVPAVHADVARLAQVFLHLLVNAAQAIPEGAPQRHRLDVRTRRGEDGRVVVEIADTGVGIHRELLPHIFEPFFTTKAVGEGTGLGLDISWRIVVNKHRGDLRLRSEPGDTRFQVLLPLTEQNEDQGE